VSHCWYAMFCSVTILLDRLFQSFEYFCCECIRKLPSPQCKPYW
jgi:hypothetical protein